MASLNLLIMFITLFFFLFLLSAPSTRAESNPNLLNITCNKTNDYQFCINVLQSYPQTASQSDSLALTRSVLQLAMVDTMIAREQIRVLLRRVEDQPELKKVVQGCLDEYSVAVAEFNVSSKELEDPQTATYDAALTGAESENCEKAISSARIKVPEISALNQKLTSFYRISMAFTEIIVQGSPPEDQSNK